MIKRIILDLWQTLTYRKVPYISGKKISEVVKSKIPYKKFVKIFERLLQLKLWSSEYLAYANLCRNIGLPLQPDLVNRVIQLRHIAESNTKLYNYTLPLLRQLKGLGYKIGLLSNSSVLEARIIKKTRLFKYIDYPLFSYQVGVIKPLLQFFNFYLRKPVIVLQNV